MTTNFTDKLHYASEKNQSLLCVGLDPVRHLMPDDNIFEFNRAIIDATRDLVCCYKPNLAFYEAFGPRGLDSLRRTLEYIPDNIPVIGDAKRGDIGNTARACAASLFDYFGFDAITVNPYLGVESLAPFLAYADKGVFVLCRTSNPGSADFQSLPIARNNGKSRPLYMEVAARCNDWNASGNVGLVVGATYPEELRQVRDQCPNLPILLPGIGAQGGDLSASVANGLDSRGAGLIIASSRQILYASQDNDFTSIATTAPVIAPSRQVSHTSPRNHFSEYAGFARINDNLSEVPYGSVGNYFTPRINSDFVTGSYSQGSYASQGADFAQRARDAALNLRDRINECRVEATARA